MYDFDRLIKTFLFHLEWTAKRDPDNLVSLYREMAESNKQEQRDAARIFRSGGRVRKGQIIYLPHE